MKKLKMVRSVKLTFEEGCNKYLENCRQRNLREGTINHYRQSYVQFYKFFDPKMPIEDIDEQTYKDYALHLKSPLAAYSLGSARSLHMDLASLSRKRPRLQKIPHSWQPLHARSTRMPAATSKPDSVPGAAASCIPTAVVPIAINNPTEKTHRLQFSKRCVSFICHSTVSFLSRTVRKHLIFTLGSAIIRAEFNHRSVRYENHSTNQCYTQAIDGICPTGTHGRSAGDRRWSHR